MKAGKIELHCCKCGQGFPLNSLLAEHFEKEHPIAPNMLTDEQVQPEHDWQWYDRNLRATGYTDLANRMLAEFKPQSRIVAADPDFGRVDVEDSDFNVGVYIDQD